MSPCSLEHLLKLSPSTVKGNRQKSEWSSLRHRPAETGMHRKESCNSVRNKPRLNLWEKNWIKAKHWLFHYHIKIQTFKFSICVRNDKLASVIGEYSRCKKSEFAVFYRNCQNCGDFHLYRLTNMRELNGKWNVVIKLWEIMYTDSVNFRSLASDHEKGHEISLCRKLRNQTNFYVVFRDCFVRRNWVLTKNISVFSCIPETKKSHSNILNLIWQFVY